MKPSRVLVRLNPKTQSLEPQSDATGPRQGISAADCAAMLSGVKDGPMLLIQAVYADNTARLGDLMRWWEARAWEHYRDGRMWWRIDTDGKRRKYLKLAMIALEQYITPGICYACLGRGHIYRQGERVKPCGICGGSGKEGVNMRDIARRCGIRKAEWRKKWHRIYISLHDCLSGIAADAMGKIRKKGG